jgi:hypothetical protein
MHAVWAHALYTPYGRISDFFGAGRAPGPRRWGDYKSTELEVLHVYVGDMTHAAEREFRLLATPTLGYEHAQHTGPQARFRNQWLLEHMLEMMADVPSRAPAD